MILSATLLITLAHLGPALADIHTSHVIEPMPRNVPVPKTLFFPKNWQAALQSKKGESLQTTCDALFTGVWGKYGKPEGCESYRYVSYCATGPDMEVSVFNTIKENTKVRRSKTICDPLAARPAKGCKKPKGLNPNTNSLPQEFSSAYVNACYCVRECDYNPPSVLAREPGTLYKQNPVLITNRSGKLYAGAVNDGEDNYEASPLDARALIWARTANETKEIESKHPNVWYPPNILFTFGSEKDTDTTVLDALCAKYFKDAWSSSKFGKPDPSSRCSTKTTYHCGATDPDWKSRTCACRRECSNGAISVTHERWASIDPNTGKVDGLIVDEINLGDDSQPMLTEATGYVPITHRNPISNGLKSKN